MAKLVRDRVPQLLLDQGKDPHIRFANDDEYWKMLKDKLSEEVEEFKGAETPDKQKDELADLLEAVDAVMKFKCWKKMDIEAVKNSKAFERGKFEKRMILE
jgi:predicted house-cleaning noncanonical NTP pyrophosphatase (MazG superfamily)